MKNPFTSPLAPDDTHNRRLLDHVHPADWSNPVPDGRYNLVVVGAGTAGLVTAAGAAGLGAKVALIERNLMGGDCLNVGCVPSKSLIRAGRAVRNMRDAARFGVESPGEPRVDFARVMERVRQVRADISHHDSAKRFRELGVDVFLGDAVFRDRSSVTVGDRVLNFAKAVVATGARAAIPDVPGLREVGFLTNENVFNLTSLPQRLAVIGGGPIGCELAQAFQALGAAVTLFHNKPALLDREDPDAAAIVQAALARDGVNLKTGARLMRTEPVGSAKRIHWEIDGKAGTADFDQILVATGRAPNVQGLGLDAAGVEFDDRLGVRVDDYLQTTNPDIYAAGDVAMRFKFTHAADFAARMVIQNALFSVGGIGRKRLSRLMIPRCTYTEPEIAHVGLDEAEANRRGIVLDTYVQPFSEVDRAITDGEQEGMVKIHVKRGTDTILGATIVGRDAGDLISEITTAMAGGVGLGKLANVIHPYPTRAEAIRKCGDQFNRTRLKPGLKKVFEYWLRRRRS